MTKTIKYAGLLACLVVLFTLSCKKDKPKTVPTVTTTSPTEVTTLGAKAGGKITSNGGADITERGVVYSNTVSQPTLADNKVVATVADADFTVMLSGLVSGTTYHVRAYATNSVGTAYGDVVDFATGNAAPVVTNIMISGTPEVGETLTATYDYSDNEGDAESGSILQWYMADDATGAGEAAIAGATQLSYSIQEADAGKYLRIGVTPKTTSGNAAGAEVKSAFVGAVGESSTDVTFTYNGQTVTYGIIISPTTGKQWLDRNLGASSVPSAVDDHSNYGDFFQWGRLDDGHQVVSRSGAADENVTGVNGTTTTLSTSDDPGHSQFIIGPSSSTTGGEGFDWRTPQNHDLWQGVDGANNPCPEGWRIPTKEEWAAENITSVSDGFAKLNLTYTGFRVGSTGDFSSIATGGFYWSSSAGNDLDGNAEYAIRIRFNADSYNELPTQRSSAYGCRCIKD